MDLGLVSAKEAVEAQKENHCGSCGLDTAATATRIGANKHDNNEEEQGAHAQVGNIHGV